ncbi:hypothetical protein [Desulfatitalea alkaliphila]|uniref:Uncharacterized protein n=1 Tax=Desulfatitalea alkaliphila TaxID=2929485 RepID=A0AA41UM71_9BACT|nr:hypothetical protein [Desulfatitalea alkaliphila]MCJ8503127.1 hypothetical protein [Desulfatitalea alkaliphila]
MVSALDKPFTSFGGDGGFRPKPNIHGPVADSAAGGTPQSKESFLSLSLTRPDGSAAGPEGHRDSAALLEAARAEAMARGRREGREEAARMALAALNPALKQLADNGAAVTRESDALSDVTAAAVMEFAQSVAAKILEATPTVTLEQLGTSEDELRATIAREHAITLPITPAQRDRLKTLMAEEGLPWPANRKVKIGRE